jgi:hypothetical protein
MTQAVKSVEQVVAAIQALDLDPIKLKLMDPEEGQGWSREYVERMETAYKRFLILMVKFPEETIAPTKDVDKFWHGHILDTMKYAEDCQSVFGYFLHHFPYFGMRGEEDAADLRIAAEKMHVIYEQEFGEALPAGAAWCTATKSASAWCTAAKQAGAWCTAAKSASAWCTAAKPASAWCTASRPLTEHAAWCTAAKPVPSAWCTASKTAAWCTASHPKAIDVSSRPTLQATK